MSVWEVVFGIILMVFSILIIGVVLLQEGRSAHLSGTISGGAETFLGKNRARTLDSMLSRWTKVIAIVFFILTIVINAISFFAR